MSREIDARALTTRFYIPEIFHTDDKQVLSLQHKIATRIQKAHANGYNTPEENGHHKSKGDCGVKRVKGVLHSHLFAPFVGQLKDTTTHPEKDAQGVDLELVLSDRTEIGQRFIDTLGIDTFQIQVKTSERQVDKFMGKHLKRERDVEDWIDQRRIVVNGQVDNRSPQAARIVAVDTSWQMINVAGALYDPITLTDFLSLVDPELQRMVTDPALLRPVLNDRYMLIRKLNPFDTTGNKSADLDYLVDEFQEAGKALYNM